MCQRSSALLIALCALTPLAPAQETKPERAGPITQLAHLRLAGPLEEGPYSPIPVFGPRIGTFQTRLERIRKAAGDQNVGALVLQFDDLQLGFARMEELRRAIAEFKKSGKKVFAYLESGSGGDYLVACEADHVCMPASAALMLIGLRAEIFFYKELLDRLDIRAEYLHVGIFKSAAEPYLRTGMSKEAKAQYNLVFDDLYAGCYVGPIARARKGKKDLTPAAVRKLIDEGPLTARQALAYGLIDEVVYPGDFPESIRKVLGVKDVKLVRDYGTEKGKDDLSTPIDLLKVLNPASTPASSNKDRIAILYAVGSIVTGKGGPSFFGASRVASTTMVEAIREAEKDPKVRALVLRVDSPGGSALASDLIWHELKRCRKPVVASMGDYGASGGYYVSMGARKVYAQPGTLTGSIGVLGGKLAFGGLYNKVGLTVDTVSRGKNAGLLSRTEPFSPSEKKALEALMQEVYEQFLDRVAQNRAAAGKKFTRKQLLDLAEGRIWTGTQALERGLVDALGSLEDAIADAKVLGGLARDASVDYLILPKPPGVLDAFLDNDALLGSLSGKQLAALAQLPELAEHARALEALLELRAEPVWVTMPHRIRVR
jgi:protease-4